MSPAHYDAIVIGSGIGGLAAAAVLARYRKNSVLVLEQCFNSGGQTQEFCRPGGYRFDTGLQYVGEMADGQLGKNAFDYITNGALQWNKIDSPLEQFCFPDYQVAMPDTPRDYCRTLIERFPSEAKAIRAYFTACKSARNWALRNMLIGCFPAPLAAFSSLCNAPGRERALMTTAGYLQKHFSNPRLRDILSAQWGTYGLPPQRSSFAVHAAIQYHFLHGAWYPHGGSGQIARTVVPTIEAAGGTVLRNTRALRIDLDATGAAAGVTAHQRIKGATEERHFTAPVIISSVGLRETARTLLPSHVNILPDSSWETIPAGSSVCMGFVTLKDNPANHGFTGANYWIFDNGSFDSLLTDNTALLDGKPTHCWLSYPSLKDPVARSHTAILVSFVDSAHFQAWSTTPWQRRGEAYAKQKEIIGRGLIGMVDNRFPGFSALVSGIEVSTPLSMEYFTGKAGGEMYGLPATPDRFRDGFCRPKTAIKNLYLAGSDAFCPGIVGAMWGGISAASAASGSWSILPLLHGMKFNLPRLIADLFLPPARI